MIKEGFPDACESKGRRRNIDLQLLFYYVIRIKMSQVQNSV